MRSAQPPLPETREDPSCDHTTCVGCLCADVGKAFTDFYYQTFDSPDRSGLQNLYQDNSLLTFENEPHMGVQAIMTKLTVRVPSASRCSPIGSNTHRLVRKIRLGRVSPLVPSPTRAPPSALVLESQTLNFQTVQHLVATLDCQPHGAGILVMVVGDLAVRTTVVAVDHVSPPASCLSRSRARH